MMLYPFRGVDECPKCLGRKSFQRQYVPPSGATLPKQEHFVVTCRECEYCWWENVASAEDRAQGRAFHVSPTP